MSEIETLLKEIQIDEIEMKLKRDEEGKIEDEIKLPNHNYILYSTKDNIKYTLIINQTDLTFNKIDINNKKKQT